MALLGSSFFTVSDRPISRRSESEAGPVTGWLVGEHDLSTDDALCLTLARAISLDSAGLVLDLSQVSFMAASTLGVIVRAREFLQQRSRSLTVRSPSAAVLRVVRACGLNYPAFSPPALVESSELAGDDRTEALGTWVAVPTAERAHGPTSPAPRVLERLTAPADGAAIFLGGGPVSVERLAESG